MSYRISSQIASLRAAHQLGMNQRKVEDSMRAIASGSRLQKSAVDPAGVAISETLRGQVSSSGAALRNADSALSFIQVAEGGLNEQGNILIRLRELAVQSASDTLSDREREFVDLEFQELKKEIDRVSNTTQLGTKKLLQGRAEDFEFQVGTDGGDADVVKYTIEVDTTLSGLGIDNVEIVSKNEARRSLDSIDEAIYRVVENRAQFGAIQSRLESVRNTLEVQKESLSAARSQIADADLAMEFAELTKGKILTELSSSVLAQANQMPQAVLRLLS